jgi:hypothetical protein
MFRNIVPSAVANATCLSGSLIERFSDKNLNPCILPLIDHTGILLLLFLILIYTSCVNQRDEPGRESIVA